MKKKKYYENHEHFNINGQNVIAEYIYKQLGVLITG